MIDAAAPFVLLDDGRDTHASRLFRDPVAIVTAAHPDEVRPALDRIARAAGDGLHAAGYVAYEAGYALEARLAPLSAMSAPSVPLLWFGLFATVETIASADVAAWLPDPASATSATPVPGLSPNTYEDRVRAAARLIAAGDIYQANLSFPATVRFAGSPLALFASLRTRAQAGWGGVLFTGAHWLLSASPELFFTLEAGEITARPMKGTAPRGATRASDLAAAAALAASPKQRAENLMIVDLTRNDLSRVSVPGTVRVPHLFTVETYPTVHHLTSTVVATLSPGLGPVDVLRTIFPCGSITGAPKIAAMQAIADLEDAARGAYTGSMGWIAPDGDAAFNVMIRTLTVADGAHEATMGLGAGIVADSVAYDEWRECLSKGAFVTRDLPRFDLLETMRFDPHDGIVDLEAHLDRMAASADALGFAFNRHDARNALHGATFRLVRAARVRVRLARGGGVAIEVRDPPPAPEHPVSVALRPLPIARDDFRLAHKTSARAFWHAAPDAFETIYVDADGRMTEGSFTSLFVERDEILLTPRMRDGPFPGMLPGILRARLIAQSRAAEADLTPADCAHGLFVGNALRGLLAATLIV